LRLQGRELVESYRILCRESSVGALPVWGFRLYQQDVLFDGNDFSLTGVDPAICP
jgi:hypothetical protein